MLFTHSPPTYDSSRHGRFWPLLGPSGWFSFCCKVRPCVWMFCQSPSMCVFGFLCWAGVDLWVWTRLLCNLCSYQWSSDKMAQNWRKVKTLLIYGCQSHILERVSIGWGVGPFPSCNAKPTIYKRTGAWWRCYHWINCTGACVQFVLLLSADLLYSNEFS